MTITKNSSETTVDELAEAMRAAKQRVEREKALYYCEGGHGDYERMAAAGKALSNAMYAYQKAKYPAVKVKRIAYQVLIR